MPEGFPLLAWAASTESADPADDGAVYLAALDPVVPGRLRFLPCSAAVLRYYVMSNTAVSLPDMPYADDQGAVADVPPGADGDGALVVMGGNTGAPGGDCTFEDPQRTVQVYEPAAKTWRLGADMPVAVYDAAAAVGADGLVYVFGGATADSATDALQVYDPISDTWHLGPALPGALVGAAAVEDPATGLIYLAGGARSDDTANLATYRYQTDAYDPGGGTWTVMDGRLSSGFWPMYGYAAMGGDGRIWAVGQTAEGGPFWVEAYTPPNSTAGLGDYWSPVTEVPLMDTDQLAAVVAGGWSGLLAIGYTVDPATELRTPTILQYGPRVGYGPASGSIYSQIAVQGSDFGRNDRVAFTWQEPMQRDMPLDPPDAHADQDGELWSTGVGFRTGEDPPLGKGDILVQDQQLRWRTVLPFTLKLPN